MPQRFSQQRERIYQTVLESRAHPTAEMVYQQLKPSHPGLSLGTVYRNLIFFRQQGLIQSVGVVGGQERFDGTLTPHSHFVCDCCGSVLDMPDIHLDGGLDQTVSRQYGLSVQRHELTFRGLCQSCAQSQTNQPEQHYKEETSA